MSMLNHSESELYSIFFFFFFFWILDSMRKILKIFENFSQSAEPVENWIILFIKFYFPE